MAIGRSVNFYRPDAFHDPNQFSIKAMEANEQTANYKTIIM